MKLFIVCLNCFVVINHFIMMALLFWKKNNNITNKVLGVIIILPVFAFITNLLIYVQKIDYAFVLVYLNGAISLLFGPSILYFIQLLYGKPYQLNWKNSLHFLPFFLAFLLSFSLLFLNSLERKELLINIQAGNDIVYNIVNLILLIHILGYIYQSWKILKNKLPYILSFYSELETARYNWIKSLIVYLLNVNIFLLIIYIISNSFFPKYLIYSDLIIMPFCVFIIYMKILINAVNSQVIFTNDEYQHYKLKLEPFNEYVSEAISSQKYGNTAMKEDELTLIQQKLEALMTTEKTYIDRELNLNKLSEIIGISSHQLSQCINRIYDKNFYDYINFHRVNEAKQLMQNSQYENFKIEVIGEKAGFNSRTTFFSVFKKFTGESPSAFKKNSSTF